MTKMTGGEAIAKSLVREGVEVVFGLPGVQLYGIMAGLRDEPTVRFITTRHEQATGYMADGYARAGGGPGFGTALVVPGPGLLNAAGGLSTAYSVSSPVFMISGQVQRDFIGKDVGMLHEVNDQLTLIEPITKWRKRVLKVGEIPAAVQEAVYQLKTGRPRPVEIGADNVRRTQVTRALRIFISRARRRVAAQNQPRRRRCEPVQRSASGHHSPSTR